MNFIYIYIAEVVQVTEQACPLNRPQSGPLGPSEEASEWSTEEVSERSIQGA